MIMNTTVTHNRQRHTKILCAPPCPPCLRGILKILFPISLFLSSCEEVINIDLNDSNPAFVVEAIIYKDSLATVHLSQTTSYFSEEEPADIENATITLSDGSSSEELVYTSNGYYTGNTIIGTEGKTYKIEISHDGKIYEGVSYMADKADIISIQLYKSEEKTIYNPEGKTVFTIRTEFHDNPETENFYMMTFIDIKNGSMIEKRYFLITEENINGGGLDILENNNFAFSESIFYEGGTVDVNLFSIDEPTYNYFMQLDDVLFWKRRALPPSPYNPVSNINNGALGYFAAWGLDSERIVLE
ncbi:MAG: DUF4249 domain-containing protein [Bacteroidales bacterium]|nr:DUF4249 domain-containing protein [Bacteroidales bacterium]MCF8390288.1 DUF4249 domain-containing protein [Bacteroidales bacterium]